MKKLRIFDLLTAIQPIELKRFQRYMKADSTFLSRDYIPLVDHLLKFYPDFKNSALTMESMYNALYPGKKYNSRVIISRLSELNRMTENFLLSVRMNKDLTVRNRILTEILMERKSYESFDLLMDKLLNREINLNKISERQLFEVDQLLMIKGQATIEREKFSETNALLQQNIETFLIYVITRLLTMYCGIRNLENFQISGTPIKSLDVYMKCIDVESLVKQLGKNKLSAYMKVMVQIYRLYDKDTNDKLYFKAKKDFLDNIGVFEQISKFTVFSFLYSYCVLQLNLRRREFVSEVYDILTKIISHAAYTKAGNEYMPSMLYREYVLTALKMNDIRGAEKFIASYTENLAPENRETLRLYSLGKIHMHRKDFSSALAAYSKCPKNINVIGLDIKIEKLVCLYELGEIDRFRDELN
ncbi:MAG: hypothetical protein JNK43_06260, partial [Ignavibacteria bacterium]|nr:hypothetical protein [Ignavibacteria bacterium]